MLISLILQITLLVIVGVFASLQIIYFSHKDNHSIDYYSWIQIYKNQKDDALNTLKAGNEKIKELEKEITKYKKLI